MKGYVLHNLPSVHCTSENIGAPGIRVGLIIPKLEQTKAGEMVSSYDYISHFNCFRQHIGVTAFYSEALLVYVVKNSSCM